MSADPFAPVPGRHTGTTRTRESDDWEILVPVPVGAPTALGRHPKLGKPKAVWTYNDAEGRVLGYVHRYDTGPDSKEFRPLTLWRSLNGGKPEWRWVSWPPKRPLYGLDRLAARPFAPVILCEGEKASDAAGRLLPGHVAVTSANGAKSAVHADWRPLRDRVVVIWPDADAAGQAFAQAVARAIATAGARSVAIVSLPSALPVGWDAADAEAAGWTSSRAAELLVAAIPFKGEKRSARRREHDDLIGTVLGMDGLELWRDGSGSTYATVPINGHAENLSLRGFAFERWLSGVIYRKSGDALSTDALDKLRRVFEIKAYEGPVFEPAARVGASNGHLYLDLCDNAWRAVEITTKGWRLIERPPVKFLRSPSARGLPEPQAGDLIERLRRYINVATDGDFVLIVSWLVAALRPDRPFPILIINGPQGTGKSVLCRMLRALIDPDVAPICAAPANERDLTLAAANTWMSAFDNLSDVGGYLPDALCRIATGGGFRTRALHTNREEIVLHLHRPVLLNGIPSLTSQADVADRSIVINLASISPDFRRTETELWLEFESDRARILGALLDGAQRALAGLDSVRLTRPGRMADFERWAIAAAPAFGWTGDDFQAARRRNESAVVDDAFEADAVAVAIRDVVITKFPQGWEDSATALLNVLDAAVPERTRKVRSWPKSPAALGNRVKRAKTLLEQKGFTVDTRHSGSRTIIIVPPRCNVSGYDHEGELNRQQTAKKSDA